MYRFDFLKKALLITQILILLGTALTNSARSQGLNFVDINQSRQFFNRGNRQFKREIELSEKDWQLPKIKLPKNYRQSQEIDNLSVVYRQVILKPISNTVAEKFK